MSWFSRVRDALPQLGAWPSAANSQHSDDFVQLRLEPLEERRVLSVTAALMMGELFIFGDADANDVSVELLNPGTPNEAIRVIDLVANRSLAPPLPTSRLDAIHFDLMEGDDQLQLQLPSSLGAARFNVDVVDGPGHDIVRLIDNDLAPPPTGTDVDITAERITFGDSEFALGDVNLNLQGTVRLESRLELSTQGDTLIDGSVTSFASGVENPFAVHTNGGSITVTGMIHSVGDVRLDAGTGLIDVGSIDSSGGIELSASRIDLAGDLNATTVDVNGVLALSVDTMIATTGDVDLSAATIVVDQADLELMTDAGGDIHLATVLGDGSFDLQLNSPGTTDFGASLLGVRQLSTDAPGMSVFDTPLIEARIVSLNDSAILKTDVTFQAPGGSIRFGGPLDSATGESNGLVVIGPESLAFAGPVGMGNPLEAMTFSSVRYVQFAQTLQVRGDVTQTQGTGTTTFNGTGPLGIGGRLDIATDRVEFLSREMQVNGSVRIDAQNDVAFIANAGIDSGSSTILIRANQDGVGSEGFTQSDSSTLRTANESANAVRIEAGGVGDIGLARVLAGTTSGRIAIDAGGAILDATTAASVVNLTAHELILTATTGVGAANALETSVAELTVLNACGIGTGTGLAADIRINNVSGQLLSVNGAINSAVCASEIEISNDATLRMAGPVVNSSGGGILLDARSSAGGSDLIIDAPILATGPRGDIEFRTAADLVIHDTGFANDVQGASVTGHADGDVLFADNVVVRSATGAITSPVPMLGNVETPQVTAAGIAVVRGDFGRANESTFVFEVLWDPDGPIQDQLLSGDPVFSHEQGTIVGVAPTFGPGAFEFDHFYPGNPDELNPANPIPITITLFDDPQILFTSRGEELGRVSITSLAEVPGEGLASALAFDLSIEVPPVEAQRSQDAVFIEESVSALEEEAADTDVVSLVESDLVSEDQIIVIEKIAPSGDVATGPDGRFLRHQIRGDEAQAVLEDLPGLYDRLQDGHWRIYLKQADNGQQQLISDVTLRNGRPAGGEGGTLDRPPTEEDGADFEPELSPQHDEPTGESADPQARIDGAPVFERDPKSVAPPPVPNTSRQLDITVVNSGVVMLPAAFFSRTWMMSVLAGLRNWWSGAIGERSDDRTS